MFMERIKEFVLNLPIDWILHGTDVPVIQLLLVGVVVAAICAVWPCFPGCLTANCTKEY